MPREKKTDLEPNITILTDHTEREAGVDQEGGPDLEAGVQEGVDEGVEVAADRGIEVVAGVAVEGGTGATTEIVVVLVVADVGIGLRQEIDHDEEVHIQNSGLYQLPFQWNILARPVGWHHQCRHIHEIHSCYDRRYLFTP